MTHVPWHPDEAEVLEELHGIESVELVSVGIDIGTTTTHLMFSRLIARRASGDFSSKFHIEDSELVYESPIRLTPYVDAAADVIDVDALDRFFREANSEAGYGPEDVDTGVVIVTGEANRAENAAPILDLFSGQSGRFVCATAGANLETLMAAHGSGAVDHAVEEALDLLHVDVGGGTTKLAYISEGFVEGTASINIGARLLTVDSHGRVQRLEDAARLVAEDEGIPLNRGAKLPQGRRERLAERFAEEISAVVEGEPSSLTADLLITDTLEIPPFDAITFSGGVAEYIYGRESDGFGDLGPELGTAIRDAAERRNHEILEVAAGIRATAIGSNRHTVQLSGNTITITDESMLPVHNVPLVPFVADHAQSPEQLTNTIEEKLDLYDADEIRGPFALGFHLHGFPRHDFLDSIVEAAVRGWERYHDEGPLILAFESDVAMNAGRMAANRIDAPVIAIDGVELAQFGYLDIGEPLEETSAVPLTVKSLLFEG